MFYYRYRSGSELSVKELIYDELYFASRAECNDPYEGKIFAIFEKNEDAWNNLIRLALKDNPILSNATEYLVEKIVSFYIDKSPIIFEEFINTSEDDFLSIGKDLFEKTILKNMLAVITRYALAYMPEERYFASFSRKRDINLMWAHYANNHRGFCLIFRPINGKIRQNKHWEKSPMHFQTPYFLSPEISIFVPDFFEIRDIEYVQEPKLSDGFTYFPEAVIGKVFSQDQIKDILNDREKIYLQKHSVWEYEEESRVILQSGHSWLVEQQLSLSPYQRLIHYDPIHLAGIIVGVNMPKDQRSKIEEIMAEKARRQVECLEAETVTFDVVLFEEKLSPINRTVEIVPYRIYNEIRQIDKTDKDFGEHLKKWEEGYAVKYTDSIEEIQLV